MPETGFYLSACDEYEGIKTLSLEAYTRQAYDSRAAEELSKWLRISDTVRSCECKRKKLCRTGSGYVDDYGVNGMIRRDLADYITVR